MVGLEVGDTEVTKKIMPRIVESLNDVTPEWLGEVLGGEITNISLQPNDAFNSSMAHLTVAYSNQAELPANLILKLNKDHDGQNEIQFYRFAASMELPMIPGRLGWDYDSQTGFSYLVIEDISNSHMPPIKREQLLALDGVPGMEHLSLILDAIAQFHARFWEHPLFGSIPVTTEMRWWYRDEEFHAKHVERRTNEWGKFVDEFKDEVPNEWIAIGESALEMLPRLFESRIKPRLRSKRALTMSQGDCYLTQFLVPRNGLGQAHLIDFQDASVNFPAYDLVYLFATFWTREQRAEIEQKLLGQYLQRLQSRGVDYDWDSLTDDYRLCLCYMFFDAVWNAAAGSSREYWMPKMNCLVSAYQDWNCAGLNYE